MGLVKAAREMDENLYIVVVTGFGTIESAVEAVKLGAVDYITKEFTPQGLRLSIEKFLKEHNLDPQEIDLVFAHQASESIIKKICKKFQFPFEKCQNGLKKYGNTGAASIPISLSVANTEGLLQPGQKILLIGGAAGFSTGIVSLIW